MNRRDFLGTGLGTIVALASSGRVLAAAQNAATRESGKELLCRPCDTKLDLKPVMTNIIHTGIWEEPGRWRAVSVTEERSESVARFERWRKEIGDNNLNLDERLVNVLDPVHLTFSEDFMLGEEQLAKVKLDGQQSDALFIYPAGSTISCFEICQTCGKPIILKGLNCRNVDIAAYSRSKGKEAFVAANDEELKTVVSLLRARKVFVGTKALFPASG